MSRRYALIVCGLEAEIQQFIHYIDEKHEITHLIRLDEEGVDTFTGHITTVQEIDFQQIDFMCIQGGTSIQAGIVQLPEYATSGYIQ